MDRKLRLFDVSEDVSTLLRMFKKEIYALTKYVREEFNILALTNEAYAHSVWTV